MKTYCLFDLDRTLLTGRTIEHLATTFGLEREVQRALEPGSDHEPGAGTDESARIARLFAGIPSDRFAEACSEVAIHPEAPRLLEALHAAGCGVGIATAGYHQATRVLAQRFGIEDVAALHLEVVAGRLTGQLHPSPWSGGCGRPICKANVLEHFRTRRRAGRTIVVGDGRNDVCMMDRANLAIAVGDAHPAAIEAADLHVADLGDVLDPILSFVDGRAPQTSTW